MQFPSSRYVSGAAREAVGKGVIKGWKSAPTPALLHSGHAGGPSPGELGSRGWRDGDSLDEDFGAGCAGRKDTTAFLDLLLKLMIYRGLQSAISRPLISPAHNLN